MTDPRRVLNVEGCAALLGVCTKTVKRWVKGKGLPCHRLSTTEVRFFEDEVLDWVRNHDKDGHHGTRAA